MQADPYSTIDEILADFGKTKFMQTRAGRIAILHEGLWHYFSFWPEIGYILTGTSLRLSQS